MHSYLFLDIDGVLNTNQGLHKYGAHYICRTKAKFICHIIRETTTKIVISSSWRTAGIDATSPLQTVLKTKLSAKDFTLFTQSIIGATPIKFSNYYRGNEIRWWFQDMIEDDKTFKVDSYVILDDIDGWFGEFEPELVKTENKVGLTKDLTQKVIEKLKTPLDFGLIQMIKDGSPDRNRYQYGKA